MDRDLPRGPRALALRFTGGEATLRPDLPELVRPRRCARAPGESDHQRRARVQIAPTQGRSSTPGSPRRRSRSRRPSPRCTISSWDGSAPSTTPSRGADLRLLGIHVHTNTTLSRGNHRPARDLDPIRGARARAAHAVDEHAHPQRHGAGPVDRPVTYAGRSPRRLPVLVRSSPAPEGVRWCGIRRCRTAWSTRCSRPGRQVVRLRLRDPVGRSRGSVLPCSSFRRGTRVAADQPYEEIFARARRGTGAIAPICRRRATGAGMSTCAGVRVRCIGTRRELSPRSRAPAPATLARTSGGSAGDTTARAGVCPARSRSRSCSQGRGADHGHPGHLRPAHPRAHRPGAERRAAPAGVAAPV